MDNECLFKDGLSLKKQKTYSPVLHSHKVLMN